MKYNDSELPDNLLYNKDSSWIKIEGDIAAIGVIEPIAKVLKEFLFIKLPEQKTIKAGEVYVSLETLKWSGHLTSPLTGKIIETNESLYDEPNKINEKPYESWILKMEIDDKKALEKLFKPDEIIDWLDKTIKGGEQR
ncbi:MAG: glycine cleavage system protein H [Candidatus Woesearchaeota archaeon]